MQEVMVKPAKSDLTRLLQESIGRVSSPITRILGRSRAFWRPSWRGPGTICRSGPVQTALPSANDLTSRRNSLYNATPIANVLKNGAQFSVCNAFVDPLLNHSKNLQNNPSITSVRRLFVLRWLFVRVKAFLVFGHAKSQARTLTFGRAAYAVCKFD